MAVGALIPLLGQYLALIGFSGTQIGSITACGTGVAILTAPLMGVRYNRSKNKKKFHTALCVAAAIVCMMLFFTQNYFIFLFIFCALFLFQAPSIAFLDAAVIEDQQPFGAARKWGAIGFALGVFFTGEITGYLGLSFIFFAYATGFLISAVILFRMSLKRADAAILESAAVQTDAGGQADMAAQADAVPMSASVQVPEQAPRAAASLLKNRKYILIVASSFFVSGPVMANNIYFGFLFIEGGGTVAGIGLAFLLMGGSEAPFMAWSAKLAARFTLEKTLLVAMCLSVLRFAWYGTGPSSTLLLAFFFLQGMVYGIMLIEFIRYVAKVSDPKELGLAISVYYALGNGLSSILCQMVSGIILDFFGARAIYLFFACLNIVGVVIYVAAGLYRPGEEEGRKDVKSTENSAGDEW